MPGLVPGIHVLRIARQGVDGRVKPGHAVRGRPKSHHLGSLAIASLNSWISYGLRRIGKSPRTWAATSL